MQKHAPITVDIFLPVSFGGGVKCASQPLRPLFGFFGRSLTALGNLPEQCRLSRNGVFLCSRGRIKPSNPLSPHLRNERLSEVQGNPQTEIRMCNILPAGILDQSTGGRRHIWNRRRGKTLLCFLLLADVGRESFMRRRVLKFCRKLVIREKSEK